MALVDFITRSTKVFDPSQNRIFVANLLLDGVTSITVDTVEDYKVVEGTHPDYATPVKTNSNIVKISVSLLPTADCNNKLRLLKSYIDVSGGMFEIAVHMNGFLILSGASWFTSTPAYSLTAEPSDLTWTFSTKLSTDTTEIVYSEQS